MQPGRYLDFLGECRTLAGSSEPFEMRGRLTRAAGLVMEAVGLKLPVGAQVLVVQGDRLKLDAEVVGFSGERLFLMPTSEPQGLRPGAMVVAQEPKMARPRLDRVNHPWRRTEDRTRRLPIGDALLGRVLGPNGDPLDRRGALTSPAGQSLSYLPLTRRPINAMEREPIRSALDVGVRAINALLTVGRGQRIGLFAGSGVGKSVLMGMMARYTSADVTVVGLVGERGREVKEFIEDILGPQGLRRAIVVAAPADTPPLMRLQAATYATAIAEHFRDRGQHVLLLMDSLTRYAMAAREIALAIGEPPATKGYPPSVFARLPQLVERAGNAAAGGGSITGFYTVLTEGDDPQDPIADAARAILDGHIVLSRRLAEAGHYPAIDVEASISRVMPAVTSPGQYESARRFKSIFSRYQRNRDLISVGAYVPGADPSLDVAITAYPHMEAFLQQPMDQPSSLQEASQRIDALLGSIPTGSE
ncbi:MAG TPA: flagellar protein export ATPase FliI [Burkholderiaceae bacterium]|nr:flagellar protein export ATPase FliI [Burkholderiaceae bacterium]